jgi:hypothetical protein
MPTKFSMKAFPSSKDSGNSLTGLAAAEARLELQPQQIFDLLAERRDPTDEELELIEMRYHQALALMSLQALFAEGQLDGTRRLSPSTAGSSSIRPIRAER